MKGRLAMALAGLLLLDFVIILVMLATDKNLQTNFGTVSAYYLHWYGVLVLGVVTLIMAVGILVNMGRTTSTGQSTSMRKYSLLGGMVWSVLAIVAMVAVLATYQQVGFSSASEFSKYLFGVTAYPGALSYVPWLYDFLLALFVVSAIVGVIAVVQDRATPTTPGST